MTRTRMPIDPALRRMLDALAAMGPPPADLSNADRVQGGRAMMARALASRDAIPGLPNGVSTRDIEMGDGMGDGLAGRLYLPPGAAGSLPVMVYLHGGGWVVGSVETHDPFCRLFSAAAGVAMVSVEYRLAPEHPYPAALEDTLAAVRFVATHAAEWGGDPARLAIGGDSAGGNLAAVGANLLAATDGAPALVAAMLLFPVTDHPGFGHPSHAENAVGYGLEMAQMRWLWEQYAPGVAPNDPGVSPLRIAAVPKLPPVLVATAEYDVLRDEGIAYAEKLVESGVDVTHLHAPDMNHNFPVHPGTVARFPQCRAALAAYAAWLTETLQRNG